MQNILSKFNKEKDFFLDPFPHIILDNPIDDNDYKILSSTKSLKNIFIK